jgi:alkylhydroperoxidase/carboxymuconolactone decarboxylase family protein YurZ
LQISNWVEQRVARDVTVDVRGALDAIDKNEELIKLTLAVLMTPE